MCTRVCVSAVYLTATQVKATPLAIAVLGVSA